MAKNSVGRVVGEFYVGAFTKDPPSNAEWEAMLSTYKPNKLRGSLIYTDGGAPSAIQRKQMRDYLVENNMMYMKGAILTKSMIVRIAITALNVFIKDLASPFSPENIDEALTYLQAPKPLWPEMKRILVEMKKELDLHDK